MTIRLSEAEFLAWYWLKAELIDFCRREGLSTAGTKSDLAAVIAARLAGRNHPPPAHAPRRAANMPAAFSLSDTIGAGWTCSPALGAFFRVHAGRGFRFNRSMRDFIHAGEGKTLAQALDCWRDSVAPGRARREIAPSLEYNRHTREFYAAHPTATRAEVIAAWWVKRGTRKA